MSVTVEYAESPLTRIASCDAIRPLPASGGEVRSIVVLDQHYRRVSRQPAASASSTEQNQRVPLAMCIWIFAYQRLVGL